MVMWPVARPQFTQRRHKPGINPRGAEPRTSASTSCFHRPQLPDTQDQDACSRSLPTAGSLRTMKQQAVALYIDLLPGRRDALIHLTVSLV